jgi:hypothetical protein
MSGESDRDQIADAICAVTSAALPSAIQTIKWNAPNFEINAIDLITLNFSPNNPVRIVFHRAAKSKDTKSGVRAVLGEIGRLTWATVQRAYASFKDLPAVEEATPWLSDFWRKWADGAFAKPR